MPVPYEINARDVYQDITIAGDGDITIHYDVEVGGRMMQEMQVLTLQQLQSLTHQAELHSKAYEIHAQYGYDPEVYESAMRILSK